jgi:hypothetical protein
MTVAGEGQQSPMSWARGHLVLIVVLAAAIVGLVVLTVVAFGGSDNLPSSPMGSKAAGAQAATTETKGSKWLADSQAKLSAVTTDLARVMTAERAGSHSAAAKAAGAKLAAAAAAALRGPMPPVAAATYQSALRDLEAAGTFAAKGRFGRRVSRLLAAGQAGLMKVTSKADTPVPAATPAIPEPNGQ